MSNSSARPRGARTRKIGAVVATLAVVAGLSFGGIAASASDGTYGRGSSGEAVRQVQQRLIDVGFPIRGGADGVFGAETEDAIRDFQEAQGYKVTGRTNPATLKALGLTNLAAPSGGGGSTAPAAPASTGSAGSLEGLGRGSRGEAVRMVQQRLIDVGFPIRGGADGYFGAATEDAIRDFQGAQGYQVTGRTNRATIKALGLLGATVAGGGGGGGGGSAPAATSSGATSVVGLQLGARGPAVATLQQRIMDLGWPLRGGADGVFGAATQNRVLQFQRANGLSATGVVDARTAGAMGLGGGGGSTSNSGSSGGSSGASSGSTASGFPRYDERGARVVALQQALIAAGISFAGGADGVFGSATAGAIMSFQRARGLAVSGKVDEATAAALGLSAAPEPGPSPSVSVSLEARPVQGPCDYRDTFSAARSNGRVHLGTDIIAAEGNEVYAVASGTITKLYTDAPGSLSGNGLRVARSDGTYFFYAHLSAFAPGIASGTAVSAGQLIGYVGQTGNAGTPHLHLEVHPGGGAAVNPYPIIRASGAC
jgi:peptidoglycan hydrolase-like protein with peptidoglycan-binding domain